MRLVRRPLRPGETDYEALLGVLGLAGLAVSFLVPPSSMPLPRCGFRAVTGLPCPTCGMTRAVHALTHLEPLRAAMLSPLGALAGAGGAAAAAWWLGACLGRPRRLRIEPPLSPATVLSVLAALLGLNWIAVILLQPFSGV